MNKLIDTCPLRFLINFLTDCLVRLENLEAAAFHGCRLIYLSRTQNNNFSLMRGRAVFEQRIRISPTNLLARVGD